MDANVEQNGRESANWAFSYIVLALLVVLGWLGLSFVALFYGELNQDEGWYLYAARLLRHGQLPYRDFAFTQGPVMPLAYALLYGWVERFGVAGGRAATFFFSSLGMVAAVWLSMRLGPRDARRTTGGLCFILLALNAYQCTFSTMVKTYGLTSFLLMLGFLFLSRSGRSGGVVAPGMAGFCLALAAATRISYGLALAAGGIYLLFFHRRTAPWAWLDFGLGGAFGLGLLFLPFFALGKEGFLFGLLEYHTLREGGAFLASMQLKVGTVSRLIQAYFPAFLFVGALAWHSLVQCRWKTAREDLPGSSSRLPPHYTSFLWITLILLSVVHLLAPFPYDDYQVPLYPLLCALVSAGTTRHLLIGQHKRFAFLWACTILVLAYAFASPSLQGWFIAGRDRIWWNMRSESSIGQLRRAAREVRRLADETGAEVLLTQDIYLAVEAGMDVPHGLEMGPFSYYPRFSTARAEQVGVVNRAMLLNIIKDTPEAGVAAMSGYSFSIRSPEVLPLSTEDEAAIHAALNARYETVQVIPHFGQAATPLELRVRKKAAP